MMKSGRELTEADCNDNFLLNNYKCAVTLDRSQKKTLFPPLAVSFVLFEATRLQARTYRPKFVLQIAAIASPPL